MALPIPVVVLTAAAVDMRPLDSAGLPVALPTAAASTAQMRQRVRAVLHAAHAAGCRSLVLGAWGCGVFANDPTRVATLFAEALASAEWRHRFDAVVFPIVHGRSGFYHNLFRQRLHRLTQ